MGFTDAVGGPRDQRRLRRAHESLLVGDLTSGALSNSTLTTSDSSAVRTVVADSWLRSVAAGVDADVSQPPITLEPDALLDYRAEHPLSRVFPLLYDVLGRAAEDCDSLMAIADAHGQLLWVCGQPGVLRQAEGIHFVEGSLWDETHAGTNAPGTALRLDAPVVIDGVEHFAHRVQRWSCAAAPIHDPFSQDILGLVDITGGSDIATPQTIAMVRAAARMAESELARLMAVEQTARLAHPSFGSRSLGRSGSGLRSGALSLEGLGRPDCVAALNGRTMRLSPRHSEIAVILSRYPDGLTGDELALELYPADVTSSTLRAEMLRLRGLLGDSVLASRPYRLIAEVESDWTAVSAQVSAGNVGEALRLYRGPLLPQSEAPGVRQYREELQRRLRSAVLQSRRPEFMVAWTRGRWGADDLEMWQRQLEVLPLASPLRPLAMAEVAKLDAEYGC